MLEAEATGVYEAFCWIEDLGIRSVVIEFDSLNVVNAIQRNVTYHTEVGNILDNCKTMLQHRSLFQKEKKKYIVKDQRN